MTKFYQQNIKMCQNFDFSMGPKKRQNFCMPIDHFYVFFANWSKEGASSVIYFCTHRNRPWFKFKHEYFNIPKF